MSVTAGSRVYLKAARGAGEAGTVIRCEGQRVAVYWPDLDFVSRHRPESLEAALVTTSSPGQFAGEANHTSSDWSVNASGPIGQRITSPCDGGNDEKEAIL